MRFSILLILFLSSLGSTSFAVNPELANETAEEYSLLELKHLICSKQWSQSSNENHVFIFNSHGLLEVFRMTDENKLSATQLIFKLEVKNGKNLISLFNAEQTLVNTFSVNMSGNRLHLKGLNNDESINLIEKGSNHSVKTKKLAGEWRGRQLMKSNKLKKGKYEQEEIRFQFNDNGSYKLDSKRFGHKASEEKGKFIILADSDSIILKPHNKLKRPYLIQMKHVSESELVLSIMNNRETKATSNLTLLR